MSADKDTIRAAEEQLAAMKRLLAAKEAKDDLLKYVQFTMPDPEAYGDVTKSAYEVTPQARLLCQLMQKVERGEMKRLAVSIGPQLGKSELLSRRGPAWISGRNPRRHMILASYNQDFANEFGFEVRGIIESQEHQLVFPKHALQKGGQSKDLLVTEQKGKLAFVGVGGSGTGKPADLFVVDDPIRNDEDVQSDTFREKLWKWFNTVAMTRCHTKSGIIVVHTRWHEDDLIGRLCDPEHPERNKLYAGIADRWEYVNLPAVIDDPKLADVLGLTLEPPTNPNVISMFGTKPMSSIWPERKNLEFLAEAKQMDERGFGALYLGKPVPDSGEFFKREWLVEYEPHELPTSLRKYGASDHAVTTKQERDANVLGCVGIDEHNHIWVMPDLVWDRMETDRVVEEIIGQMKVHQPMLWWMESELISKSFGPFLHKRMQETQTYCAIDPVRPMGDKRARAQSVKGRMAMRMVHFPRFAPWWSDAKAQLLRFPFAAHDDFVDWLAHIGLGLVKEVAAPSEKPGDGKVVTVGSIEWILAQTKRQERVERRKAAASGW